ncbi:MAG: hypothetical protein AAF244_03695 [Pseudomonadota bacterium]
MSKTSKTGNILLALIAVVLVAILALMLYQMNQKTPAEKAADNISEAAENIGKALSGE